MANFKGAALAKTPPVNLIRNLAIIAHIDHGKTTLTDNFMGLSGIISNAKAGQQLFTDFHEDEMDRGITINSSTVSFAYTSGHFGETYLINLVDSPGHVDFSGEVAKAMRAADGAILVVDAVEGVMTQTQAVIRQALSNGLKLVLYINKTDRLIQELRLNSGEIGEKIKTLIKGINALLQGMKGPDYRNYFAISKCTLYSKLLLFACHNFSDI